MNRNDEFTELKKELEESPAALKDTAVKAIARAKKSRIKTLFLKTPLISFCSIAVAFVILVNLFPAVALAMSNALGLKALIHAVAINPSLKLAVEHDYYQEIGESQTKDDVTVTVDYMILDAGNITFFFHVDAPVEKGSYHFEFLDSDKKNMPISTSFNTEYESGKLEVISIQIAPEEFSLPKEFFFHVTVNKNYNYQETMTASIPADADSPYVSEESGADSGNAEISGVDYDFTFALHPDAKFTDVVNTIPVKKWVTINDQKIFLDTLYIYPSSTRLSIYCDVKNTSVIEALDVSLVDAKGTEYNWYNSLYLSDDPDRQDGLHYLYFESCYFSDVRDIKLYVKSIAEIDKDKLFGKIDYTNRTIGNMPDNITIEAMDIKNDTLYLTLKEFADRAGNMSSVIDSKYFDINEGSYYLNTWSFSGSSKDGEPNHYYYVIPNFKDNFYLLRWSYKIDQLLDQPVAVDLN